jgi:hypothetical protein
MNLLSSSTRDSVEEIISYFSGFAIAIANHAYDNSKAQRLSKVMVMTYKDSNIPFRLDVWSESTDIGTFSYQKIDQLKASRIKMYFSFSVKFPTVMERLNGAAVVTHITESTIGLSNAKIHIPPLVTRIPGGLNVKRPKTAKHKSDT